jgi:maleate isomerase
MSATTADRITVRVDHPGLGLRVDLPTAETLAAGSASIRHDAGLDQRQLETVAWLETNRRNLIQASFADPPHPPEALKDAYGVRAQMLGPLEVGRSMAGWISVHSTTERAWTEQDAAALDRARIDATALLTELKEA